MLSLVSDLHRSMIIYLPSTNMNIHSLNDASMCMVSEPLYWHYVYIYVIGRTLCCVYTNSINDSYNDGADF